ncbi:hypothetical protein RFI_25137 [Reticulomyxa filosa]|uniref:Uncharacterized protein n=1 Tax=Reticulomyxa filosa TaxID=46433 RepID=X6MEA3_RETFI|nr:hypothetical protein RFI_25137 [Reticulomyxa filosa]|eukprot:ETO12239.1 hypothetical protein RFI_25137 [Reticulomyxa filosa]
MAERKDEKDEEEKQIFSFLKDQVKIDGEEASKLASYLRREEKLIESKDTIELEPQQWKKIFIHVELAPVPKRKLLKKVNEMRKSENQEPLDINEIINSRSSIRQRNCCVNQYRRNYAQILLINGNMATIILEQVQLKRQQKKKDKLATFNLNDDKWKNVDLKSGDEILCEYSFESNSSELRVDKIEFPVLYQGEVKEDGDSQFVPVQVHCIKSVLLHTTSIYHHYNTFL